MSPRPDSVSDMPVHVHSAATAAGPAAPPRASVLVVDDDEGVRATVAIIFKKEFDVHQASDAETAVQLARRNRVDLAILDLNLAGTSGLQVLELLKDIDPDLEAIIVTGNGTLETARQAMRLGACDYLAKPFHLDAVREAVAGALRRRERTRQLREAEEEARLHQLAEEQSRLRGEIYATVLHDLNSPLTAATGLVDLAVMDLNEVHGDMLSAQSVISDAAVQLHHCVSIVERYLNFTRRARHDRSATDLSISLADLKRLLRVSPLVRHNELVITEPSEPINLPINGLDLLQVLVNLVTNALQAGNDSHRVEVKAVLRAEPVDLNALADRPGCRLVNDECFDNLAPLAEISVTDDGPGIPEEILSMIFQSFFTTKSEDQGSGLGLSIVQRLLSEARGLLHVSTHAGRGSCFTIYLPAHKPRPA